MFYREFSVKDVNQEKLESELRDVLFPLEIEIVERLYDIYSEGYAEQSGDKWNHPEHWTHIIKDKLFELGRSHGYLVYPIAEQGSYKHEWMFDLVWVDAKLENSSNKFDWKSTRGLKLACECEWKTGEDDLLEDFFKLTFALSDLRLFIYTNIFKKRKHAPHPVQIVKKACPLSKGYRYLLVGYPNTSYGTFRVDSWVA
jgi:hypothetical protein